MACLELTVKDLTQHLNVLVSRVCNIAEPEKDVVYLVDSTGARLLDSDNNKLVIL